MSVQQHLTDHFDALKKGDIDALMTHYDDKSILIHQEGVAKGAAQIKEVLEFFITAVIPPSSTKIEEVVETTEGNIAYIVWSAESHLISIPYATDTFVFEGDIIRIQTAAGVMEAK